MNFAEYYNKVLGGWLGRVAGSHFGTPLEFRPTRYTLRKYGTPTENWGREFSYFVKQVDPNRVNDDEIYQIVGLLALESHGPNLTTKDIGKEWKQRLYKQQFTAEKVALQNLKRGKDAPECASPINGNFWFDAIGAQMKADIWGLVTPNCPRLAAEYARIDGAVAHQGTGIDGEVFIATIISQAFSVSNVTELITNALQFLPQECEYRLLIERVIRIHQQHPETSKWKEAHGILLQEWSTIRRRLAGEARSFGRKLFLQALPGLHVLPNAGIIVLSLLYAQNHEDPFGRALCLAGMMGMDTDCNCGNIGTIMGTILGADRIAKKWTDPLQDTFRTYVRGYEEWTISELARRISSAGQRIMAEKCPEHMILY